jgi:glycosyltransferase involved in cell wall biosynthesis
VSPRGRPVVEVPRPGLVSVVIVAGDAAAVARTQHRLGDLELGETNLETIIVDPRAGAALSGPRASSPIRVVGAPEGCSLAAARNLGVEAVAGSYLAFLVAGAEPDARWLSAALEAFRRDSRIAAVASKVVRPDGSVLFDGAAMTFAGEPRSLRPDGEAGSDGATPALDVLFACDIAMVVETQAFRWIGGFDETLTHGIDVADLGWRLWLNGFRVRYDPESWVTSDAEGAQPGPDDGERIFGSLAMIYKNYDDMNLGNAVAAAVLEAQRTAAGTAAAQRFGERMPALLEARNKVQSGRVVADHQILPLFRTPLETGGDVATRGVIQEALDVERVFSQRHRIAVVTPDTLRPRMAGPAIRAWQIALALAREHDVQLASTTGCELSHEEFSVVLADEGRMHALEQWCDVMIFQGHILDSFPWLRRSNKVLVVDLYDPFHLEVLEQSRDLDDGARRHVVRVATEVLNTQLARGDFFMCASDKQRDFWLGQLAGVGRINPAVYDGDENLEAFLAVVPFGVSDEKPERTRTALKGVVPGIGPHDKVVLWGGGVYNWFDPLTLVRAIDRLKERVPNVRLYFMGMRHPNADVPAMRMALDTRRLVDSLELLDTHVFFNEDWIEYDERQNYLLDADVGVSTHLDHIETAFSFRTRILDYLWASLPIVATSGDSFADVIERRGLGMTVPAGDEVALEEALFVLLTDDAKNAACRAAAAACADEFRWTRALAPLLEYCRAPRRSPDLLDPRQRAFIGDPMAQLFWGRRGLRHDARVMIGHVRRREYDVLMAKVRLRARTVLFPETRGPGAR